MLNKISDSDSDSIILRIRHKIIDIVLVHSNDVLI